MIDRSGLGLRESISIITNKATSDAVVWVIRNFHPKVSHKISKTITTVIQRGMRL